MKITALDDFGMDLSQEGVVAEYARRIPPCSEESLQIDFSGCIIDYPATSKIIDAAFLSISNMQEPRNLILFFNINFKERMLLKAFFIGSETLGLDGNTAPVEEIRTRLTQHLEKTGVRLYIKIYDIEKNSILQEYKYG